MMITVYSNASTNRAITRFSGVACPKKLFLQVSTLQLMTVVAVQVIHVWKTSRLLRGFLPWNEQTSWACLPTYLFNRPPVGNGQRSQKVEKRTGVFMVD